MGFLFAGKRLRIWGIVFLGLAILMLVLGETALNHRLSDAGFLLYWLFCFGLTCVALGIAFLDVRATQNSLRDEQRSLLDKTMRDIQGDARVNGRAKRNGR